MTFPDDDAGGAAKSNVADVDLGAVSIAAYLVYSSGLFSI